MALTLTLAQLRAEVGRAIDVPIGDAYIPTADVDLWLNMAVQEYAQLRAQYGLYDAKRTTITGSTSATAGSDGFPANEVLSLPTDFASVVSLNLNYQGAQYPLTAMSESDRVRFMGAPATTYGPPECYAVIDATPSLSLPARARVWPPMQSQYTFELIYRPQQAALALTSDTWEYLPGTEDYVICTVAIKQSCREGIQEPSQFQALQMRKQSALDALIRMSSRGGGVQTMRDTRSLNRARRVWPWL